MKKQFFFALFILSLAFTSKLSAQQDAHFTQYMFNQLYFNPAAGGIEQGFRGGLLYREQWAGYKGISNGGAPRNILFTGSLPILSANTGIGLVINSDQIGPLNDLQASVSGAYQFKLGSGKLCTGIRIGMHSRSISNNDLRVNDETDPNYLDLLGASGQLVPDFGFGLYYNSDKFFVGASSTHLAEPKFDFSGAKSTLNRHYYFMGGYNFDLSPNIVLTPSVNLKYDSKVFQWEASALARINNQFLAGLAYREQDAVSVLLGLTLLENKLRLTYSLDYTVPATEAKRPTSHEIMASYFHPITMKGPKPIIRTPRYRK
jgi:type IX secretion system PorP/SprF family membrane protein